MKRITLKIICTAMVLASCTSYVWDPINRIDFENTLNQQIGKGFTQTYPRSGTDNLINETETFKEYIQDKYDDCSWVVKVENESNKILGWHYAYPARCTRIKK